ncbi:nucleotidyl transferase AbiEii/AbiGii toxin family protein [Bradyrhizobium sp. SRL28]|uniref:nucleotidyl transferase AbiEii/AbiGii toxin family protein n=1 Tax=Bradyrhizobium sp. SRL28 TaxID=2836178 RepID=UPI00201C009E
MIPALNIVAWSQTTPWVEQRQVEQDLIISRALVALFSDEFLKAELGGTALNNLHFPKPLRYSEDIDLVYRGRPDRAGVDPRSRSSESVVWRTAIRTKRNCAQAQILGRSRRQEQPCANSFEDRNQHAGAYCLRHTTISAI